MFLTLLEQVEAIGFFSAIRDSAYAYPVLLWLHLVTLAAWAGIVLVLGLGLRSDSAAAFAKGLRRPRRISFMLTAVCGLLLFGAKAGQYGYNPWFWIKMALLALIGANDFILRRGAFASAAAGSAKLAGGLSLLLLMGAVWAARGPATVRDLMHSVVDPNAEFLFESVQVIADEKGIREIEPRTDQEWADVRAHIEILMRVPDLLSAPGLRAGRPRDRSAIPEFENGPAEVQKLILKNPQDFAQRAERLREAAAVTMRAAEAKDKDALLDTLTGIDRACEGCHVVYWYPRDAFAVEAARAEGIIP